MFDLLSTCLEVTSVAISLPLLLLGFFTCYWMSYAWHSPRTYEQTLFVTTRPSDVHSFSIIIPVRDESYQLMRSTVACVLAQSHPRVQTVISVGFDDEPTLAAAHRIRDENPGRDIVVAVSHSTVHNKPTQLNSALRYCTGEFVGLLDAESQSAPDLLSQVDATIQETGTSVVQGGVLLVNYQATFVSRRAALEYYLHHRSKMHFSTKHGAVLMGGNTVFFRRSLLDEVDGWDAGNLAEDAEISLRLLTLGHEVTVAYDSHLVSREEAPTTVRAWTKQRVRWNVGFLQTLSKGVWRDLPTRRQRAWTLWHLLQPSLMAITGLALPVALAMVLFVRPPLPITFITFAPAVPTVLMAVLESLALVMFGRELGCRIRFRDQVGLVLSLPVYQLMLSWAALLAAVKYARGDFAWSKTHHPGSHLVDVPEVAR